MVEEKVRYERWQKTRTFVRAVEGKYAELYQQLYEQPRVFKTKKMPWIGGPAHFGKFILSPSIISAPAITQAIESHIITIGPGSKSQKHGHMNSAVLYVLEGKGYEIHDGKRLDWQAGDACVVRNGCVHQHFNLNSDKPARVLVMKSKPLFLFFNMVFQKNVEMPPEKPLPGWEDWKPQD